MRCGKICGWLGSPIVNGLTSTSFIKPWILSTTWCLYDSSMSGLKLTLRSLGPSGTGVTRNIFAGCHLALSQGLLSPVLSLGGLEVGEGDCYLGAWPRPVLLTLDHRTTVSMLMKWCLLASTVSGKLLRRFVSLKLYCEPVPRGDTAGQSQEKCGASLCSSRPLVLSWAGLLSSGARARSLSRLGLLCHGSASR